MIRLLVGERQAITSGHPQLRADEVPDLGGDLYTDAEVVAKVEFRITNQSGRKIFFFPGDMYLVMGGRQAVLEDFVYSGAQVGDSFNGDVLDTVTVRTGAWVGLTDVDLETVDSVTFSPGQAWISTTGTRIDQYAGGFTFAVDVTERTFEPPLTTVGDG